MDLQIGISEWVQSEVTCKSFSTSPEHFCVGRLVEVLQAF